MRTVRAFFPKSVYFFQFSKRSREGLLLPPPTFEPVYYKIRGKREEKGSWKCLPKGNWNSPCNIKSKAFFKKISWSEISLFIFQFSKGTKLKTFFSINPDDILIFFVFVIFYTTTRFKISSHVLWLLYISSIIFLDTFRTRCHFAFWLHMFPLHNTYEDQTFLQQKITLKSPLPLLQCRVFWLSLYSVPYQPWWMNLSW